MPKIKKFISLIILLCAAGAIIYSLVAKQNVTYFPALGNTPPASTKFVTTTPGYVLVTRVVDGDTIQISTGEKVRYIGMNTPETVDPRKSVECFGHEASDYNKQLVEGKEVRLVADAGNTDTYGRLLRYVYLPDGTLVNQKMVADGYANVMTIPPNVKFASLFRQAELAARNSGLGLWSKCK